MAQQEKEMSLDLGTIEACAQVCQLTIERERQPGRRTTVEQAAVLEALQGLRDDILALALPTKGQAR